MNEVFYHKYGEILGVRRCYTRVNGEFKASTAHPDTENPNSFYNCNNEFDQKLIMSQTVIDLKFNLLNQFMDEPIICVLIYSLAITVCFSGLLRELHEILHDICLIDQLKNCISKFTVTIISISRSYAIIYNGIMCAFFLAYSKNSIIDILLGTAGLLIVINFDDIIFGYYITQNEEFEIDDSSFNYLSYLRIIMFKIIYFYSMYIFYLASKEDLHTSGEIEIFKWSQIMMRIILQITIAIYTLLISQNQNLIKEFGKNYPSVIFIVISFSMWIFFQTLEFFTLKPPSMTNQNEIIDYVIMMVYTYGIPMHAGSLFISIIVYSISHCSCFNNFDKKVKQDLSYQNQTDHNILYSNNNQEEIKNEDLNIEDC